MFRMPGTGPDTLRRSLPSGSMCFAVPGEVNRIRTVAVKVILTVRLEASPNGKGGRQSLLLTESSEE
jgi:hypothetical protein